ncbi:MAG: hypothetical protein J6Q26_03765, partial [Bacteroidales bacterium]|nr:hypothetical protein [Bacteroidales bacterium]
MRKRLIAFFLLLLCATLNSVAQQKNLSEQIRHYQSFSQQFAQEKVYLYFDNDNYLIGENIWFKAYV